MAWTDAAREAAAMARHIHAQAHSAFKPTRGYASFHLDAPQQRARLASELHTIRTSKYSGPKFTNPAIVKGAMLSAVASTYYRNSGRH